MSAWGALVRTIPRAAGTVGVGGRAASAGVSAAAGFPAIESMLGQLMEGMLGMSRTSVETRLGQLEQPAPCTMPQNQMAAPVTLAHPPRRSQTCLLSSCVSCVQFIASVATFCWCKFATKVRKETDLWVHNLHGYVNFLGTEDDPKFICHDDCSRSMDGRHLKACAATRSCTPRSRTSSSPAGRRSSTQSRSSGAPR